MLKGTVLFIDNDLDFLSTMSQVLQRQRYDVIQATGTAEAEQVLKSRTVDLAIVDIRLISDTDEKDRSGLEFAEDLRFRDVPKIVHTGYPRADLVKESLSAVGEKVPVALDFVAKEEGPQALILAVSKAMAILHVQNQTRSRCLSGSTRDVFMVVHGLWTRYVGEKRGRESSNEDWSSYRGLK